MSMAEQNGNEELVIEPGSFTGPERRLIQQQFKIPFGDLLTFTQQAVLRVFSTDAPDPEARDVQVLTAADGTLVYPDEVLQAMVWVQALRADPAAQLEDFDGLTLRDLNNARVRGLRGKAPAGGSSTTSSPESPSASLSPA